MLALCLVALALPAPGAALTIDAAAVTFNPKKTDAFAVKGRFAPFDAQGVAEVTLAFGDLTQTIPIASFVVKKGKLSFKGPKGAPGLATLTIDTVKGKFAAAGKNLNLGAFDNPAAFHLVAGALDECSTLTFAESKNKRKLASVVPACGFQAAPEATPGAFFVGTPTEIRIRVPVLDDLALDLGSLVVLRLDAALQPIGAPLCSLHDDGSPAAGDDTAVDGVFSCRFTLSEPAPARIRLAVRALRDTVLVLSPSVFVSAVTQLTAGEVTDVMTAQNAANDLWDAALAELGNTKKARKQAIAAILELPGIANARLAKDGVNIVIDYANGLTGGLDLDPVGEELLVPASPAPAQPIMEREAPVIRVASSLQVSHAGPAIGNNKVLIWSPFYNERGGSLRDSTDAVETVFRQATCPVFEVTILRNEECNLASIATFKDYGTLVLLTHGSSLRHGNVDREEVGLMTREKATIASEWLTHATDLKLDRVIVYNASHVDKKGYFIFFPSYIESVTKGEFPSSVVFGGGCTSAGNRTMANAFFSKGALAYVGFSSTVHGLYLNFSSTSFFQNLLQAGSNAAEAFARVPQKTLKDYMAANRIDLRFLGAGSEQTLATKLTLLRGDERLGYPCDPPTPGLVESVTIPAAPMANEDGVVGTVRLQAGVQYRLVVTGTAHSQSGPTFGDFDAVYCFHNSAGNCNPPFPTDNILFLYTQFADEEPAEIQTVYQFAGAPLPGYTSSHRYEFSWQGQEGRLWLKTFPQIFPGTGVDITGSFTVQIFRD